MTYLDLASELVKRLEGCRLTGYLDSGGVPTNGFGHTGPEVVAGVDITQEIADHNLLVDLATADARLLGVCGDVPLGRLDAHQRAALVSFVFNLGANPSWTVWKDIKAGNLEAVPAQLLRFDHGVVNGKLVEIPGLANRRKAEVSFWNTAEETTVQSPVPSSGFVRAIQTPPTPLPAPPGAGASITVKIATALTGVAGAASQVHDIVAPHAGDARLFNTVAVGATGVIIACALIGILIHGEQAHARTL